MPVPLEEPRHFFHLITRLVLRTEQYKQKMSLFLTKKPEYYITLHSMESSESLGSCTVFCFHTKK
jgi:hypothetical protein